jgi:PKD repeat protein
MNMDSSGYVADISSKPYGTIVNYKVYATDMSGNYDVSAVSSYTVGDLVPPTISNVVQVPSIPYANSPVTVLAVVTEPPEASGVKNVTMWYTLNDVWLFAEMTLQDALWRGTIPGQNPNEVIKFFVEAFDNAENSDKTSTFASIVKTPNRAPTAVFSSPSSVYTNEVAEFNASASYDSDGTITIYVWDFGDGTTGIGVNTSHSYADDGECVVTLTVYDNKGATNTKTASIKVMNKPPVADLTTSATILDKKETVTFDASSSYDPDGTIVSYEWEFGDRNTATGVSVSHAYSDSGTYSVTLTVTDNDGETDTITITKKVRNKAPVAIVTEMSETSYVKDVVTVNAADSYDPDGIIVSYEWDFGDGNIATGKSVNHLYEDDGVYSVTLTVTDNDGATDSTTATKTVLNRSPAASFSENATTVMTNEAIHFDASTSYDIDGTIVSYMWNFGDGNTATGVVVDHAYDNDGVYTVTLKVTDNDGETGLDTTTKTALNRPPATSFTESATTVMPEEMIHFDASESYDVDGILVSYEWDFGDGHTTTGITADHAYSEEGTYAVTLTVTDDDGASVSTDVKIIVEVTVSLAILSAIGLAITTLTATLLYGLFIRRKKKKKQTEEEY